MDRREGEFVVVRSDSTASILELPAWMLPPELREGDVVLVRCGVAPEGSWRVEFRIDAEATAGMRQEVHSVLKQLRGSDPGGDIRI